MDQEPYNPLNPDASALRRLLVHYPAIVFPYSNDNITCYIVSIVARPHAVSVLPWGGRPSGYLVSVLRFGTFWFDLDSKDIEIHPGYVAEKLGLERVAAEAIAQLLNGIRLAPI